MPSTAFNLRRDNLRKYIAAKFEGNRSAFARAVNTDPNQVNLILSNGEHRRNLGEALARQFEKNLTLAEGYFDQPDLMGEDSSQRVPRFEVPPEYASILRNDNMLGHANFCNSYLDTLIGKITARENLVISRIATRDMAPDIGFDEHVVLDIGVKAVTQDGVYIIGQGANLFLRRVTKQLTGGWEISTPNHAALKVDTLKGMNSVGKVVMVWKHIVL